MLWSIHPDSAIQLAEQRFRDLSEDAARVQRASQARAARRQARRDAQQPRVGLLQRLTGVALVRLGSRLLDECYPFPTPTRG